MIAYYFALSAAMTANVANPISSSNYLERLRPTVTLAPAAGGNPVPAANPGLWVTTNDYPAEALREKREGTVGFVLTVGADGMVSACQITTSSGHPDLDTTACGLIAQRARFTPAKNAKGVDVAGRYANRVRWQIPPKGQFVPTNAPIPKPVRSISAFSSTRTAYRRNAK